MAFLKAVHALKYQPVRRIEEYGALNLADRSVEGLPGLSVGTGDSHVLISDNLDPPVPPEVPGPLRPFLSGAVTLTAVPELSAAADEHPDPEEFQRDLDAWLDDIVRPWQEHSQRVAESRTIYQDLFEARTLIEREPDLYELVWGFWPLRWQAPGADIHYPLIVAPADVAYDDRTGRITVGCGEVGDIEIDAVADLDCLNDRPGLTALRNSGLAGGHLPWSLDHRPTVERVLRCIDRDGVLADSDQAAGSTATTHAGWRLFVRRRSTDYRGFLDALEEQFAGEGAIPGPLAAVVVDQPSKLPVDADDSWSGPAGSLMLPKPANEEQMRILRLAISRNGVTAQGPPGTGKSHTIANLISHFVASGKRVLVTAQKEGALAVLADKLPSEIRALCVPVLGTDAASKSQLASSIGTIFHRVGAVDDEASRREIDRLTAEIDATIRAIRRAEAQLRDVSRFEGSTAPGEDGLPSALAAWLREEEQRLGFIPDALALESSPPLSEPELAELFSVVSEVDPSDIGPAVGDRPTAVEILPPETFHTLLATIAASDATMNAFVGLLTRPEALDDFDPERLEQTVAAVRKMAQYAAVAESDWVAAVVAEARHNHTTGQWRTFSAAVATEVEALQELAQTLQGHEVLQPDTAVLTPPEHRILAEVLPHLDQGKALNRITNRGAIRLLSRVTVDGHTPTTAHHVRLVLAESERHELRARLIRRWNDQLSRVGGPLLDASMQPEWTLSAHVDLLNAGLEAVERDDAWAAILRQLGLSVSQPLTSELLTRCAAGLEAGGHRRARAHAEQQLLAARQELEPHAATQLGSRALAALDDGDPSALRTVRDEALRLDALKPKVERLLDLDRRLGDVAPRWAERIRARRGDSTCGDPHLLAEAWRWRRLESWLSDAHRSVALDALRADIDDLEKRRLKLTAELVGESAWRSLVSGFTDRNRQALTAWQNANQKYGKGTGKYAAHWEAASRAALDDAKDAIPVWIMSVPTVLRSFRPGTEPPFDVVIIDEASQCGLLELPIFALGRKVIVVGDGKQTSPENIGTNLEPINELIEEHLRDLPNRKTVFDLNSSLYAIAEQKFPGIVMLREHFRCLPDIIRWSSEKFYGGDIVCLRDRPPAPGWVAVEAIHVPEGYVEKAEAINRAEAEAIVESISEMVADPTYDDMTFGVVTLRSGGQAKLIDGMLIDALGSQVFADRDIRCGEPAAFQGDERDVVFLSVVSTTDPVTGRIGAMTREPDARRINVAASRARNKMVVVHAVSPDELHRDDLRRSLIQHCTNPTRVEDLADGAFEKCDSQFERDVLQRIFDRGYERVHVQYPVGQYRIDIVIEGPDGRLAIECDGDRWHGEDKWDADRNRQRVLERAGWTFFRVRGSAFYRDPAGSLEELWARLDKMGVPTGDWTTLSRATRSEPVGDPGQPDSHAVPLPATPPSSAPRTEVFGPGEVSASQLVGSAEEQKPLPPAGDGGTSGSSQPAASSTAGLAPEAGTGPAAPIAGEPTATQPMVGHLQGSAAGMLASPGAATPVGRARGDEGILRPPGALDTPAAPARQSRSDALPAYQPWEGRMLKPIDSHTTEELASLITEVVTIEGPVVLRRAYTLVNRAAGGQRLGKDIKSRFNQATALAVKQKRISFVDTSIPGFIDRSAVVPGRSAAVIRSLGDRNLQDVPPSEIRALAAQLGVTGRPSTESYRTILDAYGLTRLTPNVADFLASCLDN